MGSYSVCGVVYSSELYHHGVKGQKWGIRRYQNPDGTLTPAGIARYGTVENFNKQNDKGYRAEIRRQKRVAESVARGTALLDKNRTRLGAVGRGVGRNVRNSLIAGASIGGLALASGLIGKALSGDVKFGGQMFLDSVELGKQVAAPLLVAAGAHSAYKTIRDVSDITRAQNAGIVRKKDRGI